MSASMIHVSALLLFLAVLASGAAAAGLPRGVAEEHAALFAGSSFSCGDGTSLPASAVNDDYCDCSDGSDEPGTAACSHLSTVRFTCGNSGFQAATIPTSRVDDGLCDCCDGSDEPDGTCEDSCAEQAKEAASAAAALAAERAAGAAARVAMVEQASSRLAEWQARVSVLEEQQKRIASTRAQLQEQLKTEATRERSELLGRARRKLNNRGLESEWDELQGSWPELHAVSKSVEAVLNLTGSHFAIAVSIRDLLEGKETPGVPDHILAARRSFMEPIFNGGRAGFRLGMTYLARALGLVASPVRGIVWLVRRAYALTGLPSPPGVSGALKQQLLAQIRPLRARWLRWGMPVYVDAFWDAAPFVYNWLFPDVPGHWFRFEAEGLRTGIAALDQLNETVHPEYAELQERLALDFGADNVLAALWNECWELKVKEYTYKLCMYDSAKQSSTDIGRYLGWGAKGAGSSASDDYQFYGKGGGCYGGPRRSSRLKMQCGSETKLARVAEPSTCVYVFTVSTPAACLSDEQLHAMVDALNEDAPTHA